MSRRCHVEIDFFWPCVFVLVVLTWGDPDLLDALIHRLFAGACP